MSAVETTERTLLAILRHRLLALLVLLALLLGSWTTIVRTLLRDRRADEPLVDALLRGAQGLFDNRIEVWFKEDDPELVGYREFQRRFGNDEALLVALSAPKGEGLFTPRTLALVADVGSRLSAVKGIRAVTSLATVIQVRYEAGTESMEIDRMWRGEPGPETAREIERRIGSDRLLRPALVSPDGRTTLLTAQLLPLREPGRDHPDAIDVDAERGRILAACAEAVRAGLAAAGRSPDDWRWGGLGVMNEELNQLSQRDLLRFAFLSLTVLVACVGVALRRVVPVLLSLLVVYLAVIGLYGAFLGSGHRFNLVTTILPTLVLVIGVTDSLFFVSAWYQDGEEHLAKGLSHREAVARALAPAILPGLFNSITTSVGFLSFVWAPMPVLRDFGLFAALGIGLAFVCSVLVVGIGLDRFPVVPPRRAAGPGRVGRLLLEPLFERLPAFVLRRRIALWVGTLVLMLLAGLGIARIEVDTFTIGYLHPSNPVRRADAEISAAFGPYLPLEVVVDTGVAGGVLDPAVLSAIDRLEADVAARHPAEVGGSTSIAGVVKRLNEAAAGAPEAFVVPASRDLIEQLLLFYDPDRVDDPLHLVDFPEYRRARITFRTKNDSARAAESLVAEIEAEHARLFPPGVRIEVAGYVPLYVRLIDYLVTGQLLSIGSSFVVVFGLIGLLFRSFRAMVATIPANLLPVAATLGFMGWVGIDLDVGTVLIASIALGIAVDDTIHFVFRFQSSLAGSKDVRSAVADTLRHSGPPIVASALVLSLGFLVLTLAEVRSVALFGLLMTVTMVSAVIAELLVTPAFVLLLFGEGRHPRVGEGL